MSVKGEQCSWKRWEQAEQTTVSDDGNQAGLEERFIQA